MIEKIYVHEKLTPICSKLILRGLFTKLAAEFTFEFNSRFFKQGHYPSKHLSWWRCLEDVLKISFVFFFLQDVFIKTNIFTPVMRLQKRSSRRLQDVLIKTNIFALAVRLQDIFKTSSRHFDILKTFQGIQKVFKTSSGRLAKTSFEMSCKNVVKTSSRCLAIMSSRRFQDASSG